MGSTHYFAILLLLLASSDFGISSIIPGHATEKSHPMLASLFNVADQIRNLQEQTGEVHPTMGSGREASIAKAKPLGSTGPIAVNRDILNPIAVPPVPINMDEVLPVAGKESFVRPDSFLTSNTNSGSGAIGLLTIPAINIPVPNGGLPSDTMSVEGGLAADMWCSLCKQRGDQECIAIYCSKDGISSIISGIGEPPLLGNDRIIDIIKPVNDRILDTVKPSPSIDSSLTENIPVLDNNLGLGSQIDRHDLLQLKNINTQPLQNVIDMAVLNQPTQDRIRPPTETTAPIWLMADHVLSSGRPVNAVPHMIDSNSEMSQPTIAESLIPVDITKHTNNPDIVFIDGNFGNSLPKQNPHVKGKGQAEGTRLSTPALVDSNIDSQPLDVPTELFLQMIRNDVPSFFKKLDQLQHSTFVKPSNTANNNDIGNKVSTRKPPVIPVASNVFARNEPASSFVFPTGFVEDSVIPIRHQNDVTTTTRIPHIPRAVDVFPIVRSAKNDINKLTHVANDHAHSENVAPHVERAIIPNHDTTLLETHQQMTNAPSLDLHSLLHSSNEHHSRPIMNVKTTTDHTRKALDHKHVTEGVGQNGNHHQHSQVAGANVVNHGHAMDHGGHNVNHQDSPMVVAANAMHPASALQQDIAALGDIHIDGGLTEEFTTTTPIPTINPVRKAALNKFSEHLLSDIHV